MDKIIIYTNETCPYCKAVKEELSKNNIEFENKLTNEWPIEWQEITNVLGVATVPTILYKKDYFVPGRDFANPAALLGLLKNFVSSDNHTDSFIALQRLKTLNFNIGSAFSRTNQLLTQIENKLKIEENDG